MTLLYQAAYEAASSKNKFLKNPQKNGNLILIEEDYLYVNSEGTTSTDYYRNQLKQRGRLLHIFWGTL